MSDERKKAPVGTQKYWDSTGQYWIKTHDNTPFDNFVAAWIPIPSIPSIFKNKFSDLDQIGSRIVKYKEPIDGDLWLEKEFSDFTTRSGKKFTAEQFKQYSRFQKNSFSYSFNSELTKRYMYDKVDLNAKIAEILVEENDSKKTKLFEEGDREAYRKTIVLSEEEIKEIREGTRREYKEDPSQKLTIEDCEDIEKVLTRVISYLDKGENFEGDQKEIYEKCKGILVNIQSGPYVNINIVRDNMKEALTLMNTHFSDNWGIKESFRKKIEKALGEYIKKYKTQIEKDELEGFQEKLGCSLYTDTNTFYQHLRRSSFFKEIYLENYKGKQIPNPDNKYEDITFIDIDTSTDYNDSTQMVYLDNSGKERRKWVNRRELELLIRQREENLPDIDIPLKLRFENKFSKSLEGSYDELDLTLLETFEKIADYLPEGHLLTNNQLKNLRKENYFSSDNSYAHFDPSKREIFLSSKSIQQSDIGVTDIHNGQEIASVLIHEIGHAVSTKLGRRNSVDYRKFVVECGWSWEQFQYTNDKKGITKHNNFIATGTDPDIKRFGSRGDVNLITEYSHKSPEEAFAEYYSFYSQHKKHIDKFLISKNESTLNQSDAYKFSLGDKTFNSHLALGEERRITRSNLDAIMIDNHRDMGDHIRVGVLDPYYDNLETIKQKDVETPHIAYQKRTTNKKEPLPVFTVFDYHTGKHDLVLEGHDAALHYSNKYLRRLSPTFSISKECYNLLKEKGATYDEIRDYALSKVKDKKMPSVVDTSAAVSNRIRGLKYRGQVISSDVVVKNYNIFSQMKKIWESEELRKALIELGFYESLNSTNMNDQEIEKSIFSAISKFFKPYTEKIKDALDRKKDKQLYADCVIRNTKGEILLLERSYQDDFMPGKWCLPGGKIEDGESPMIAAERELYEETGIDLVERLSFITKIEKEDCIIYYFEGLLENPTPTVLDNEEHYKQQFVNWIELSTYDLIFDLGDVLMNKLNLSIIPNFIVDIKTTDYTNLFKTKEELEKAFNENKISDEEYFLGLKQIRQEAFKVIQKGFDEGLVNEEQYQIAWKKINC